MVTQRSAKPLFTGSNPVVASRNHGQNRLERAGFLIRGLNGERSASNDLELAGSVVLPEDRDAGLWVVHLLRVRVGRRS